VSSPPDVRAPRGSRPGEDDDVGPRSSFRRRLGPIRTSAGRGRPTAAIFSIVPDGAVRRRPSDIARIVAAALVVTATGIAEVKDLTGAENAVYDFFTATPVAVDWIFRVGYWLLPIVVGAILVGALVGRHGRMVAAIGLAAAGTATAGFALDAAIGARTSASLTEAGIDLSHGTPDYPPMALAVAAAAVLVAGPYLTRPTRRLARALVIIAAVSAVVLVQGLPAAVIGGIALAWGIAAAVQFALGTPAGTPAIGEVAAALQDLGLTVHDLAVADDQDWGEARFTATMNGDRLRISALGRDAIDAGLYAKMLRFVWYKDSGPVLILSRAQQVEHRAYLLLLAERAGARVPEVLAAGTAGDLGHALLVTDDEGGRRLDALDEKTFTDALLDDVWHNLTSLHRARLAHGNLALGNIVQLDDGTTALDDFSRASSSASRERMALDGAELLAGTASIVGVRRAVDAMTRTLDRDEIEQILPLLQTSAMSRQVRRSLPKAKALLTQLRKAAAENIDTPEPQLTELHRVSLSSLAMAVGAAFGVYLLLGELAGVKSVGDVFTNPNWWWVVATFVVSQTPQVAQAVGMLGSVSSALPLGPSIGVQFANQFMGLVGGTVATTALVIRYFQKRGLAASVAVSSGVLNTIAAMVAEAILLAIGLIAFGQDFTFSRIGGGHGGSATTVVIVLVVAVAVVLGAALFLPRLRKRIGAKLKPQFISARDNLRELRGNPTKIAQLFGGNVVSQLLFAITLDCALRVYGASLPIMELVVINTFASLIGGIAPVPGGMGVIEAGLIAGFTAAGIPENTAIAATFTARAFTAYLPPIWGWFSMQWLRHHDYL
jgi:uncharacterized membrane protein YbhN (UPF0104 family)